MHFYDTWYKHKTSSDDMQIERLIKLLYKFLELRSE